MVIQGNESSNCCKLTGKCQCITFHRSLRLVFSLHRIWFPFNSFKPKMCHEQVNLFFLISFGCAKLDRMWTNLGVFARRNSIFMKSRLRWFWCSFLSICTYSISVSVGGCLQCAYFLSFHWPQSIECNTRCEQDLPYRQNLDHCKHAKAPKKNHFSWLSHEIKQILLYNRVLCTVEYIVADWQRLYSEDSIE